MLTTRSRKVYICDCCKREISAPDTAAPPLPPGWSEASDYYGNAIHGCRLCEQAFVSLAEQCGLSITSSPKAVE